MSLKDENNSYFYSYAYKNVITGNGWEITIIPDLFYYSMAPIKKPNITIIENSEEAKDKNCDYIL